MTGGRLEVVAAYLGGEAPEALAATQETEEDAALDAQLEHQVEVHDAQPRKAPVKRASASKTAAGKAAAPSRAPAVRRTRTTKKDGEDRWTRSSRFQALAR